MPITAPETSTVFRRAAICAGYYVMRLWTGDAQSIPSFRLAGKLNACDKLTSMSRSRSRLIILLIVLLIFIVYRIVRQPSLHPGQFSSTNSRVGPPEIYPDPVRTPGAANPEITQENIQDTICNPHWSTKSVRPPESYTHELKVRQIREYGYTDTDLRDYEEDHLIPLEVGGNPTDPRNLWPEPYQTSIADGGAHYKDKVENYLHDQVCAGRITLQDAQQKIATDWYSVYVNSVPH